MALSSLRSWRFAASAALLSAAIQPAPTTVLECRVPSEPAGRVFQLLDHGSAREPRFALRLSGPSLGARRVDLPLANARVERRGRGLAVASVSSNGGATVQIEAEDSGASSIDVFVNYELEVNVWRDLSPDVEQMNTHGLQANARCHVLSIPEGMPYHQ